METQPQKGSDMSSSPAPRSFHDWLHNPSFEETICNNPFHNVVQKVFSGYQASAMDPFWDEDSPYVSVAKLLKAGIILPEGDVIYVRERDNLIPLGEAIQLLAYYLHSDSRTARGCADLLENNFLGYFPVTANNVWRSGITLEYPDGGLNHIDLNTLSLVDGSEGLPEYGSHKTDPEVIDVLAKYFRLCNESLGEDFFLEKALMYPFNQRIREKSHVLVGKGGNGKSMFMRLIQALYGSRAYTDAPQPNFRGHDPAVISYNFIGKRVVTFNDVGDPSENFLEWLKRMITGNLEVKTPSGAWLSVPCNTNFFLESNHTPQILNIEAHARRYVIKTFDDDFRIVDHMSPDELDQIGERGDITAGDLVCYLMMYCKGKVDDWTHFDPTPAPTEGVALDY